MKFQTFQEKALTEGIYFTEREFSSLFVHCTMSRSQIDLWFDERQVEESITPTIVQELLQEIYQKNSQLIKWGKRTARVLHF
jgi:glutamate-1-semialdehyde aminotransferase